MADPQAFIREILPYAVEVGDRYGIDPVTIITQAALETGWGKEVAGNNYFGIKSHGQPGGQSVTTHEEINGKRVKVQDHFRTYGSLADSVNDYGRFLTENPRYAQAIAQQGYPEELAGIAGSGYATSSDYPNLVQDVARSVTRRLPPLPPASLPEVGTFLDTVRMPPSPVTPSIDMAQMRRTAVPSQLGPDTFASLAKPQRPGTMTRAADIGLTDKTAVTPYLKRDGSGIMDPASVVFGGEMTTQLPGSGAARSASDAARGKTPMYSLSVGGRAPIGLSQPGNLDLNARRVFNGPEGDYRTENSMSIGTDRGEALIPTVVDGHQLTQKAAIDHFLKTGENLGMFSTPAAADRYAEALHLRQEQTYKPTAPAAPRPSIPQSTIERQVAKPVAVAMPRPRPQTAPPDLIQVSRQRIASTNPTKLPPIPPSTLGQKPGTITAKSIPMPAAAKPFVAEARYIEPRNAAPAKADFVPEARYIEPRNAPPAVKYAGPFAPRTNVAQPNGSIIPNKPEDRLLAGVANNGIDISPPKLSASGAPAYAPTPRPTIARATVPSPAPPYRAVASALDVSPLPALPRPRPNLGMGGVDIAPPAVAQTGQTAPMPMPRLQRGGIFGNPQIFGHDVPLPGLLGVVQGATKAMNNASGPFNNGADNLLYNALRGGDFNTPGAATAQSAGFLFAPKPGGGWLNVGRVDPKISAADRYASLNSGNGGPRTAADRAGKSLSQSGGARSFMEN